MKNILIILSFIFLLSIIICVNNDKIEKENNDKNKDESESNEKENDNNENKEQNEEEEENDKNLKGIYMTQKSFDERLNKIFEEKGLKNRKKITKEKLKVIFEEIYSDELIPSDTDTGSGMTPEEEAQRIVDFYELTRSYDYDDKIKISEIRNMISPKQAQDAMFTVYANLAESMGFL